MACLSGNQNPDPKPNKAFMSMLKKVLGPDLYRKFDNSYMLTDREYCIVERALKKCVSAFHGEELKKFKLDKPK